MYSFNIILTELCNANCSHCYMGTDKISKKKSLLKEDINVIVKKLPINTSTVVLTGGEIFLVKDILEYSIKLIKETNPNISIGLESNGIYLYNNLERCRKKLKNLKEMGVEFIRFSDDPFHEKGGVNLSKVRELKELENSQTPIIKFLIQDKAVPIGRAKELSENSILHANCMNKESTKENPYLFLDISGNVFTCAWKCVPSVGNILKDDWETIVKNLSDNCNQLILTGKIENAISSLTGKNTEDLKVKSAKNGQCSLCIENFGDNKKI